jgi:parallel beta-helix repeat protein
MITPIDNMEIFEDTTFSPGIYYIPGGIKIKADNVIVDGNNALFVGSYRNGQGVSIEECNNVIIKNFRLMEYYHGIYANECQDLTIENCQITSTNEVTSSTIFLDIWLPPENPYGGGIYLNRVQDSQILVNDLQHQQNGLLTYYCNRLKVSKNLANYCSGFGFHLFETSDSVFDENYADFCCRYQPRGERIGHMGADATGFLIVHNSCRNTFQNNFARMGGDGFFLAGLTPNYELVGCNENLFESNDGSYSPNIAFEGTFSQGNIYRDNLANRCNYGFWLGFSSHCTIENNQINENDQAGIATENGFDFHVEGNTFKNNGHGILLWTKRIPKFESAVPENTTSYDWSIKKNDFIRNRKAIRIAADQDHGIHPLHESGKWGDPAPQPFNHSILDNKFEKNISKIEIKNAIDTIIEDNRILDVD